MGHHIVLSVLTRELLISTNKQAITMTEKTHLCQDMEDGLDNQSKTLDYNKEEILGTLSLISTKPNGGGRKYSENILY